MTTRGAAQAEASGCAGYFRKTDSGADVLAAIARDWPRIRMKEGRRSHENSRNPVDPLRVLLDGGTRGRETARRLCRLQKLPGVPRPVL